MNGRIQAVQHDVSRRIELHEASNDGRDDHRQRCGAANLDQLAARAHIIEQQRASRDTRPGDQQKTQRRAQVDRDHHRVDSTDADRVALVVRDRQDHRHEDRRCDAEDVQRAGTDRRQLRQQ